MKKSTRNIIIAAVVAAVVIIAAAVMFSLFSASAKLADSFDAGAVTAKAEEAVRLMTSEDYGTLLGMMSDATREVLSEDKLRTNMEAVKPQTGAFQEVKNSAVIGQKDPNTGEDQAVAVVVASFEKKSMTFTLVFNTDMQITGFWMK